MYCIGGLHGEEKLNARDMKYNSFARTTIVEATGHFSFFPSSDRGRGRKSPGINHIKSDGQEAKPSCTYIHEIVPTVRTGVASSSLSVDPVPWET